MMASCKIMRMHRTGKQHLTTNSTFLPLPDVIKINLLAYFASTTPPCESAPKSKNRNIKNQELRAIRPTIAEGIRAGADGAQEPQLFIVHHP
jgi:hypothetical protein